jgi:hypothetical protein
MTLQQNTDHIQTTHIGSLPRPHNTNPHAQRLLSIASSKARAPRPPLEQPTRGGNELEFQGGAATKAKGSREAREKRIVIMPTTVMAGRRTLGIYWNFDFGAGTTGAEAGIPFKVFDDHAETADRRIEKLVRLSGILIPRPRTAEPIKASGSCETVFKGRTHNCKRSVLVTRKNS